MLRKVAEHGSKLSYCNELSENMEKIIGSLESNCVILAGPNKIYGCEVRRRHHLERKNGGGYDAQEYDEHPERYISTFAQKV